MQKRNEKCSKIDGKRRPKWLIGTEKIGLETVLATSSGLGRPKGAFAKPPAAHFDSLFTSFGPQFQYPAAVLALAPMYSVHLTAL